MNIKGIIPARYQSSRMPGKPIINLLGKPMIWWVYNEAIKAKELADVIIATDDKRILEECKKYNMKAMMTSINHDTPTSRLQEVSTIIDADYYVLIMGDEPLIDHRSLSLIIPNSKEDYQVGALTNVINRASEVIDNSNQKVVVNSNREALIISRSPIPYPKGTLEIEYEKVTGVQFFSKKALEFYKKTPKSKLECAEENDLLRFIENGIPVKMIKSDYKTVSVDTPKDVREVTQILIERGYNNA